MNVTEPVQSTNGGSGLTATATLNVAAPPTIAKAFAPATIDIGSTTLLTFTLANPNSLALAGIGFVDTLPGGTLVANALLASNTCGGTLDAVANSGVVSLSAATIAANGTCTISVPVQGVANGAWTNSVTIDAAGVGTGNAATATLVVLNKVAIPTLQGWALMLLALVLVGAGNRALRRRQHRG